jgi:hypothetical protein
MQPRKAARLHGANTGGLPPVMPPGSTVKLMSMSPVALKLPPWIRIVSMVPAMVSHFTSFSSSLPQSGWASFVAAQAQTSVFSNDVASVGRATGGEPTLTSGRSSCAT